MSVLVMVSALGAIQGLVFTGSRVYAAVGVDHPLFRALGRWHPRLGAPMHALLAQGGATLLLVLAVGTGIGRGMLDAALRTAGWEGLPWQRFGGGFETLVAATAPVFWIFFLLTGASLLRLRRLDPQRERPFRVPLYPLLPLLFCATSVYMLVESVRYAGELTLLGVLPLILGLPAYAWSARR